jgi:hypothetical protein
VVIGLLGVAVGTQGASGTARADEAAVAAKPAEPPKFRVEAMGPATLPAEFAERLATAAGAGLTAAGADVLPPASAEAAPAANPDYLLRGTCAIEGSTYRLHLELVDARTHAVAVGRDDLCEICTETEAAEATNVLASALKVALEQSLRAAPPPAPILPVKPAPPPVETRAAAPWRRALPWVAFGVGAAALGTGIYYLAINGKGTDYDAERMLNTRLNDTTWRDAIPSLGLGAAAAVVGILTLPRAGTRSPEASSPAPAGSSAPHAQGFTLTPSGLAAWGVF